MPFKPKSHAAGGAANAVAEFEETYLRVDVKSGLSYFWLAGGLPDKPLAGLSTEEKVLAWRDAALNRKVFIDPSM